jgi:hypothetical protein
VSHPREQIAFLPPAVAHSLNEAIQRERMSQSVLFLDSSSGTGGGLLRLILLLRSYASLEAGRVGVCCVCVGFHRTPQQPLASPNWLLAAEAVPAAGAVLVAEAVLVVFLS